MWSRRTRTHRPAAVSAGGVDFAYRDLGPRTGIPVIFLTHLAAVLDNWDPRVVDGIAAQHRVITFDNRGVGASSGSTPKSIEAMAKDTVAFIGALGFDQVDLFGFSMGGMIAQVIAKDEPQLVRKLILAGTGPAGGEGITSVTRISHLDTLRALLTLQDPKQFLFFTRTPNGRRAGKEFLARLKERTENRDKRISLGSYGAQLKAIHRWGKAGAGRPLGHSSARPRRERRERSDGAHQQLGRPGPAPGARGAGGLPRRRPRRHLPVPPAIRREGARLPRSVTPQERSCPAPAPPPSPTCRVERVPTASSPRRSNAAATSHQTVTIRATADDRRNYI